MKEFEEWFNKQPKLISDSSPNIYYGAELGWKAALGWAANQIRTETNGYFNILKELKNE